MDDQGFVEILGVKVDRVNKNQALEKVIEWINGRRRRYIVTPNLEFILAAQKDLKFKGILNDADLSIPDSSSLGFGFWLSQRNILIRLLLWPFFFLPLKRLIHFDILTGTDFMETLCKEASKRGFTVGFLGGSGGVAEKAAECLQKKYQNLKVSFAEDGPVVDRSGQSAMEDRHGRRGDLAMTKKVDILFVAFGQVKQEKWIAQNLDKIPVKVAMGVGGAFDYFGGLVPRAPKFMRVLGFEWLFRLILQPWRIKRQLALVKFVWQIACHSGKSKLRLTPKSEERSLRA